MTKCILSLVLLFLFIATKAQIKIGNISIDNNTAQKYFLDCYSHPDTVYEKNAGSFIDLCNGCTTRVDEYNIAKARADEFNEQLHKDAIRQNSDGWMPSYLVPRKPTEADFIKWQARINAKQ